MNQVTGSVAILGLGLMGGSLAAALKRLPAPPRVRGYTIEPGAARRALDAGMLDHAGESIEDTLDGAELVVFATPVGVTVELLGSAAAALGQAHVVTDVGSVKVPVLRAARDAGLAARFVGAHPMCGRERSGLDAASPDLYRGARVWIVAGDPEPTARVERFWRAVGAQPHTISAEQHDALVAWASHLPQIVSSALAATLATGQIDPAALGPGGRDMTRLACSPAALWTDILLQNRTLVEEPLRRLQGELGAFADAVRSGDAPRLERLLADAAAWSTES